MSATVSRWGEHGPRPEVDHALDDLFAAMTLVAETTAECSAGQAWDAVSAIGRIGEFSPECVQAWWVDGNQMSAAGARFEGRNRVEGPNGTHEWIRLCEITGWDPPRLISWTTGDRFDGTPATQWSFAIAPAAGSGVVIRQQFRHLAGGLSGLREAAQKAPDNAAELIRVRSARLAQGMAQTLSRLRALLEGGPAGTS
jgi:uncharacterized protein YndB with AHSA1/START domain